MKESKSERRLAENEIIFRQANRDIQKGLKKIIEDEIAEKVRHKDSGDLRLHVYCECADDTCNQRIVLKMSEYDKLHPNSASFVILPGHEIPEIEKVVKRAENYMVVEKYMQPPKVATKLHSKEQNEKKLNKK